MNGGCLHLSTGGVQQTATWFMPAISYQRSISSHNSNWWEKQTCFLRLVCEQDPCYRGSVHWQQLLSDTQPLNLCAAAHSEPCLMTHLGWLACCYGPDIWDLLKKDTPLERVMERKSHSDFSLWLSQSDQKNSVWIFFIWQCKDRNQRRNPNDENSLKSWFFSIKLVNSHMWTIYPSRKQAAHYSLLVGRGYWLNYLPRTKQMFYSYKKTQQLHLDNFQQRTHYYSMFVKDQCSILSTSQGFYMYSLYLHLQSGKRDSPASKRQTNCLAPVFITYYHSMWCFCLTLPN